MAEKDAKRSKTEDPAVTNFREYLRIKTVQPNPDYAGAVEFLTKQAKELSLPYKVVECVPGKPTFLMTWEGSDPSLKSVLLNSHIDVVPVFPEHWKYDPFSAEKEENGDIFARGTQDMKCVGIQYLEAIRRLQRDGQKPLRTFHLSFVPDEEIGGVDGMVAFLETDDFKKLNIGFALDEGLANPDETYKVFYAERLGHGVKVTCKGQPGHGSRFIEDNAAEKMRRVINSFLGYRDAEEQRLKLNPKLNLGDVTTVNLNKIEGGVQLNVVPDEYRIYFDIRVTPTVKLTEFEAMIAGWCKAAGSGVSYEFLQKGLCQTMTPITKDDPWFNAFSTACENMGVSFSCEVQSCNTDSRFLREKGYPAIGFSPMNKTPILLHDHNEYLNEDIFLRGINIYCAILPAVGNVPAF